MLVLILLTNKREPSLMDRRWSLKESLCDFLFSPTQSKRKKKSVNLKTSFESQVKIDGLPFFGSLTLGSF